MKADEVIEYCLSSFEGVVLRESWGERGIFYNPGEVLKRGVYVLTVKEKDGVNDKASLLNRENVYRLNGGLQKDTFLQRFGSIPPRPAAGSIVCMDFNFAALDTIMPHPVYAWMSWVCVLSPSAATFQMFKPLIKESYDFAKQKFTNKKL